MRKQISLKKGEATMMNKHELLMMHKHGLFRVLALSALLPLIVSAWGCGTTTRTAALERAQAAYARAEGDPAIASTASVPLYEANQSLQKAEQAGNEAEQEHYAYIAEKQTEQAVAQARQKAAEQDLARLNQERQRMVLRSREQEAARARAEAQTSQQQAQMAREQAQIAEQQAEAARQQEARARGEAQAAAEQERLAKEQATQLESQMSELKARQTNSGNVVLTMGDVMFATNRATLAPGAMLSLDKLADILKQNPNEKVVVQGHTDNRGHADYNQQLSQQRAEAVKNALMDRGISPDRIIARGLGESFPVAGNETESGRQQNRRVDIVVTG
jgi:outer membrane protein OmpA-like peptidoglycan-associated protein